MHNVQIWLWYIVAPHPARRKAKKNISQDIKIFLSLPNNWLMELYVNVQIQTGPFWLCFIFYDFQQVTKDYSVERVAGSLTYNDVSHASPESRRNLWTEKE